MSECGNCGNLLCLPSELEHGVCRECEPSPHYLTRIRELEAQLADREARLRAIAVAFEYYAMRGSEDDYNTMVDLIHEEPIDLPTALSLAGWEEDDGAYLDDKLANCKVRIIRRCLKALGKEKP